MIRLALAELRAARLPSVELCRRLDYHGWENVHGVADASPFFLLGPLGSRRLAQRVIDDYLVEAESAVVLPLPADTDAVDCVFSGDSVRCAAEPAQRALGHRAPAIWTLALPGRHGRWGVHFLPPVAPAEDDTVASLTQRYLSVLEEWWRDLG